MLGAGAGMGERYKDWGLRTADWVPGSGLFPEDLVELRGAGAEHLPEVGAAESALVAAAGFAHDVVQCPAVLAGERGQGGEGHPLADTAGDSDGGHLGNIRRKEKGDLGLGGAEGTRRTETTSPSLSLAASRRRSSAGR